MEEQAIDAVSAAAVGDKPEMLYVIFALLTKRALLVDELTMARKLLMCFSARVV